MTHIFLRSGLERKGEQNPKFSHNFFVAKRSFLFTRLECCLGVVVQYMFLRSKFKGEKNPNVYKCSFG